MTRPSEYEPILQELGDLPEVEELVFRTATYLKAIDVKRVEKGEEPRITMTDAELTDQIRRKMVANAQGIEKSIMVLQSGQVFPLDSATLYAEAEELKLGKRTKIDVNLQNEKDSGFTRQNLNYDLREALDTSLGKSVRYEQAQILYTLEALHEKVDYKDPVILEDLEEIRKYLISNIIFLSQSLASSPSSSDKMISADEVDLLNLTKYYQTIFPDSPLEEILGELASQHQQALNHALTVTDFKIKHPPADPKNTTIITNLANARFFSSHHEGSMEAQG